MKNEIAAPLGLAMTCKDIYYARIKLTQLPKMPKGVKFKIIY